MKIEVKPTWQTVNFIVKNKSREYSLELNRNFETGKYSLTEEHEEGIHFEDDLELCKMKLSALKTAIKYLESLWYSK